MASAPGECRSFPSLQGNGRKASITGKPVNGPTIHVSIVALATTEAAFNVDDPCVSRQSLEKMRRINFTLMPAHRAGHDDDMPASKILKAKLILRLWHVVDEIGVARDGSPTRSMFLLCSFFAR